MKPKAKEPDLAADIQEALCNTLREATRLAQKARKLEIRREGATARLAQQIKELEETYNRRIARLRAQRGDILRDVAYVWDKYLPGRKSVKLPVGLAMRQERVKIEVRNKREVIDTLDRLDRLDLVDQVVDTRGLRQLYKGGKLDDLPSGAVHVTTNELFVVRRAKAENCARTYDCQLQCLPGTQSGSGKDPKDAA